MAVRKIKKKKVSPLDKAQGVLEQQELEDGSTVLSLLESGAYDSPIEKQREAKMRIETPRIDGMAVAAGQTGVVRQQAEMDIAAKKEARKKKVQSKK